METSAICAQPLDTGERPVSARLDSSSMRPGRVHGASCLRRLAPLLWLMAVIAITGSAGAQLANRIEPLGPADRLKSQRQREQVDALSRRRLGASLHGGALGDLDVLQRLLDERIVGSDDVLGLQSMGVALGDVMARNLPLEWVVVDDDLGRSRALAHAATSSLFFPVTMISKRVKLGDRVAIRGLYDDVADQVEALERRTHPTRRPLSPASGPGPGGNGSTR